MDSQLKDEHGKLTDDQNSVLNLISGKHVVLAPPGSGKTELLSRRVINAISSGINPQKMLCITFTNRAAKNMNDRVKRFNSFNKNQPPFIGTLHKFGYDFLLANRVIPASTSLLDEEDSFQILSDAKLEIKQQERVEIYESKTLSLSEYIRLKSQIELNLEDESALTQFNIDLLYPKIFDAYKKIKSISCSIDFDDVINLTLFTLLRNSKNVLRSYDWIQIDEVQDLSKIQWRIVDQLTKSTSHCVYFGDYDQSIYSFMGASHANLIEFTKGAEEHFLVDNFRSPEYLIHFFNAYALANMSTRKVKELKFNRLNKNSGGKVYVHNVRGEFKHEAHEIATKIIPKLNEHLKTIAILTRTNNDADLVSKALKLKSIEHKKVSGFDLFRRRQIKDVMAFLKVLGNEHDRLSWARLFSIFGGIDTLRASRDLVNQLFEVGLTPNDWLNNLNSNNSISKFQNIMKHGRVILFDTETTGLSYDDDIIQIAAVEIINGVVTGNQFSVYLNTKKDIAESFKIHKISQEILNLEGISPKNGLEKFIEFIDGAVLGGHNIVNFDVPMLKENLKRNGINWDYQGYFFDTLSLSRKIFPQLTSYKLGHLLEEFNLEGVNSHNAIDDVKATVSLCKYLSLQINLKNSERSLLVSSYSKVIEKFSINLSPLWNEVQAILQKDCNLADIVNYFFNYVINSSNYKFEEDGSEYIKILTDYLYENTGTASLHEHISKLLPELKTYSEADLITESAKIVVSTIHKAKGLEFEGVVIPGCVADIYPHFFSKTTEAYNEDARLFYVGLTRAKKEIVLTTHDIVVNKGGIFSRHESPFLRFLPRVPNIDKSAFLKNSG